MKSLLEAARGAGTTGSLSVRGLASSEGVEPPISLDALIDKLNTPSPPTSQAEYRVELRLTNTAFYLKKIVEAWFSFSGEGHPSDEWVKATLELDKKSAKVTYNLAREPKGPWVVRCKADILFSRSPDLVGSALLVSQPATTQPAWGIVQAPFAITFTAAEMVADPYLGRYDIVFKP